MSKHIARWESRSGQWWVTLEAHSDDPLNEGFSYEHNNGVGAFFASDNGAAIEYIERHVAVAGIAQPDNAKTRMVRV